MAQVTLQWDGRRYTFDPMKPQVGHMRIAREFTGMAYYPMLQEMSHGHDACIQAVFWLMKMQNGQAVLITDPGWGDRSPIEFHDVFNSAVLADEEVTPPNLEGTTPSSTPTSGTSETPTSSTLPPSAT